MTDTQQILTQQYAKPEHKSKVKSKSILKCITHNGVLQLSKPQLKPIAEESLHEEPACVGQHIRNQAEIESELEIKNRVLEKRCKELTAWAEQHRISKLSMQTTHEESLKKAADTVLTINKELETVQAKNQELNKTVSEHEKLKMDHNSLTSAHNSLTSAHNSLNKDHNTLKSELRSLREENNTLIKECTSLKETSRSAETIQNLLVSAPVELSLSSKACTILKSSSELLELANTYVSETENTSLHICLVEVAKALDNMHTELSTQLVTAKEWTEQRDSLQM